VEFLLTLRLSYCTEHRFYSLLQKADNEISLTKHTGKTSNSLYELHKVLWYIKEIKTAFIDP